MLSPKGTIICYKDEIIDVAFRVILYEDVQHVESVVYVLRFVCYLLRKDRIRSKKKKNSAVFVSAYHLVKLHKYINTFHSRY